MDTDPPTPLPYASPSSRRPAAQRFAVWLAHECAAVAIGFLTLAGIVVIGFLTSRNWLMLFLCEFSFLVAMAGLHIGVRRLLRR